MADPLPRRVSKNVICELGIHQFMFISKAWADQHPPPQSVLASYILLYIENLDVVASLTPNHVCLNIFKNTFYCHDSEYSVQAGD